MKLKRKLLTDHVLKQVKNGLAGDWSRTLDPKSRLCDRRGREADTLLGDILNLDGVGVAIEPEDLIVRRHCGRFTSHCDGID